MNTNRHLGRAGEHLDEGRLWALADRALEPGEHDLAESHLASCQACRALADIVAARRAGLDSALALLDPEPTASTVAPSPFPATWHASSDAHPRPALRVAKGELPMNPLLRPWRRFSSEAWLRLAAIVAVALILALPPVRAAATSFLKLFRVQKVTVLPVDPDVFMSRNMGGSTALEQLISTDLHTESLGEPQAVRSSTEAVRASGLAVRLPSSAPGAPRIDVMPGGRVSFKVDLARVQGVLEAMGKDISLPASLDGAEISARLAPVVMAAYGPCADQRVNQDEVERRGWPEGCTILTQTSSPDVSAPAGLPVDELGRAYLELLGMSPDEAQRFGKQVDWTSTLVIPVPRHGTESREVQVDGVSGTLIDHSSDERAPGYFLIWVKDGMVYALSGSGDAQNGLTMAASLGTQDVQAAPGSGSPTE